MRQQVRDNGAQIEAATSAGREWAGHLEISFGRGTEDVRLRRVLTGRVRVDEGQLEQQLLDSGKLILQTGRAYVRASARLALVLVRLDVLVNHGSPRAPTRIAPYRSAGTKSAQVRRLTAYADLQTRQLNPRMPGGAMRCACLHARSSAAPAHPAARAHARNPRAYR